MAGLLLLSRYCRAVSPREMAGMRHWQISVKQLNSTSKIAASLVILSPKRIRLNTLKS